MSHALCHSVNATSSTIHLSPPPSLGDPMLMLRAKEMYETRIASLRESEEGLGKDNRRLKEQRKDLQDEVSRLTKRLNTEVFARDQVRDEGWGLVMRDGYGL